MENHEWKETLNITYWPTTTHDITFQPHAHTLSIFFGTNRSQIKKISTKKKKLINVEIYWMSGIAETSHFMENSRLLNLFYSPNCLTWFNQYQIQNMCYIKHHDSYGPTKEKKKHLFFLAQNKLEASKS